MTKESALFAHHKPMHIARRVSNKRDNLAHRYFIVSELYRTVTERPVFTPDELAAFRWQDEQRRLRLGHIFAGKEIVWRAFNSTKDTQAALAAGTACSKGWNPENASVRCGSHQEVQG